MAHAAGEVTCATGWDAMAERERCPAFCGRVQLICVGRQSTDLALIGIALPSITRAEADPGYTSIRA